VWGWREQLDDNTFATIQSARKDTAGVQADMCTKYPCCDMTESDCLITDFPKLPSTLVFPGPPTRCIFSNSTAYAFQVWPGATDRILFYFQGGGACWDQSSTVPVPFCTTSVIPQSTTGVFNRSNADVNKFADYTIVHLLYCSGDLFVGDVVRPYNDYRGNPVIQRGQANVRATLEWVRAQQKAGGLASVFNDVVVMGCSAGSIASQVWSREILLAFKYQQAAIIPDSYIGVFPPNTQGPLIYNFGACTTDILPPNLQAECLNQTLTLQDVVLAWLPAFPEVPYSYIQSKVDSTQMSFYVALALSEGGNPILTQREFYSDVNDIMDQYNQYGNFVTYLVDGSQHCFTPYDLFYTAGPLGPKEKSPTDTPMDGWVWSLPLHSGDTISTVCEGTIQKNGVMGVGASDGTTYCSSQLYPKNFTAP